MLKTIKMDILRKHPYVYLVKCAKCFNVSDSAKIELFELARTFDDR